MSHLVPNSDIHALILERFKSTAMQGTPEYLLSKRCEESLLAPPMFNTAQLNWINALMALTQLDVPVANGFTQEQLLEYSGFMGRHNGMLDMLSHVSAVMENNLIDPAQE